MKLIKNLAIITGLLVGVSVFAEARPRPNWLWSLVQKKMPVGAVEKNLLNTALSQQAILQHPGAVAFNGMSAPIRNMIGREIKNSYFPEISKTAVLSAGIFELERAIIAEKAGFLALKIRDLEENPQSFNERIQHAWFDEEDVFFWGNTDLIPNNIKVFFIQGQGEPRYLNKMAQLFFAQFQTAPLTGKTGHFVYQVTPFMRGITYHDVNFENEGGLVNLTKKGAWSKHDVFDFDRGGIQFFYDLGYIPGALNLQRLPEAVGIPGGMSPQHMLDQLLYTHMGRAEAAELLAGGIRKEIKKMEEESGEGVLFILDRNISGRVKIGSIPMMLNEPGSIAKEFRGSHQRAFVIKFTDRLSELEKYVLSKSGAYQGRSGNVEIIRAKGKAADLLGFNLLIHHIKYK